MIRTTRALVLVTSRNIRGARLTRIQQQQSAPTTQMQAVVRAADGE
ncbi:MAG: hypothetical protein M3506_01130 [Chloroflexota bacterium]|nr:hypothetical protein [Chloroflexota bacterium]